MWITGFRHSDVIKTYFNMSLSLPFPSRGAIRRPGAIAAGGGRATVSSLGGLVFGFVNLVFGGTAAAIRFSVFWTIGFSRSSFFGTVRFSFEGARTFSSGSFRCADFAAFFRWARAFRVASSSMRSLRKTLWVLWKTKRTFKVKKFLYCYFAIRIWVWWKLFSKILKFNLWKILCYYKRDWPFIMLSRGCDLAYLVT